jgi:hypothetical protein
LDEVQKLILQVEGQERLKLLNFELKEEESNLKKLLAMKQAGVMGTLPAEIEASAQKMVKLNAELKTLVGTSGMGGQGVLGASYALQDFTAVLAYGGGLDRALMSVSNNVTQMAQGMGASAAMAAKLSMGFTALTVALPVLIPLVKDFWAQMTGQGADLAADKLKAITENLEAARDEFQKLREMPTDVEADKQKRIAGMMEGEKGGTIQDAVIKAMEASGQGFVDTKEEKNPHPGFEAIEKQQHEERVRAGNLDLAQKMLGGIKGGKTRQQRDEAITSLQGLVQAQPGMFPAGFGQDLEAPPRTKEEQTALEAQGNVNRRRMGREMDAEKLAETQQQRMNESQANRNQRQYAREQDAEDLRVKQLNTAAEMQARKNAQRAEKEATRELESEMMGSDAASETKRQRQLRGAKRGVQQGIEQLRSEGIPIGDPTETQLGEVASRVISLTSQGVATNQAIMSAIGEKMQRLAQLEQALQRQQAQASHLFGGDNSGAFSQISPFLP